MASKISSCKSCPSNAHHTLWTQGVDKKKFQDFPKSKKPLFEKFIQLVETTEKLYQAELNRKLTRILSPEFISFMSHDLLDLISYMETYKTNSEEKDAVIISLASIGTYIAEYMTMDKISKLVNMSINTTIAQVSKLSQNFYRDQPDRILLKVNRNGTQYDYTIKGAAHYKIRWANLKMYLSAHKNFTRYFSSEIMGKIDCLIGPEFKSNLTIEQKQVLAHGTPILAVALSDEDIEMAEAMDQLKTKLIIHIPTQTDPLILNDSQVSSIFSKWKPEYLRDVPDSVLPYLSEKLKTNIHLLQENRLNHDTRNKMLTVVALCVAAEQVNYRFDTKILAKIAHYTEEGWRRYMTTISEATGNGFRYGQQERCLRHELDDTFSVKWERVHAIFSKEELDILEYGSY